MVGDGGYASRPDNGKAEAKAYHRSDQARGGDTGRAVPGFDTEQWVRRGRSAEADGRAVPGEMGRIDRGHRPVKHQDALYRCDQAPHKPPHRPSAVDQAVTAARAAALRKPNDE